MRSFLRATLLVLVLLIIAMVSALTAMRFAIHGREVTVPKLIGMTPADAERAAIDHGLLLFRESRFYNDAVPEGSIVSQIPVEGAKVRRGWRVRIAESLGPQRMVIPDVVGQSPRAAEINVRRRGLEMGSVAQISLPGTPADQVIAQSPPPNAQGVASPRLSLLVTAPEQ
ncbi:MAG TPA: PASTA domain-containing protein, partial [Clostridia bacterium]|nr:PASTA domain-containing protein [Clostridia bacterium]